MADQPKRQAIVPIKLPCEMCQTYYDAITDIAEATAETAEQLACMKTAVMTWALTQFLSYDKGDPIPMFECVQYIMNKQPELAAMVAAHYQSTGAEPKPGVH